MYVYKTKNKLKAYYVIFLMKSCASIYIALNVEYTSALSIVIALLPKWYLIASTTRSASIISTPV